MANTEKTETTAVDTAAKGGRPSTRDPEGRQIGSWFSKEKAAHIREARFVKRLDKDSDVIAAAVDAFLKDIPAPSAE
ncbi:hypothetical protein [Curtobacterium phage Reje]|uniref:hypothetical protein n=1 Tax=Curtobacterium phage Reje TaxID=2851069 RepID=UPI002209ABEB|nr:hypothetical protein QEJ62_gp04 [Curtobacterium phage Reje]QXG07812.1 hypothetical protein [Curtobacterium phage Reje]